MPNKFKLYVLHIQVDPYQVRIDGERLDHPEGLLVLMHKPCGYVCSHSNDEGPRVFDLLPPAWLSRKPALNAVGRCDQHQFGAKAAFTPAHRLHHITTCLSPGMPCRLDKDTSGLLLLTTHNELLHKLTSPKHSVKKRYAVTLARPVAPAVQAKMVRVHPAWPALWICHHCGEQS
jgi:16S rRNA pseudouridine516 synthase